MKLEKLADVISTSWGGNIRIKGDLEDIRYELISNSDSKFLQNALEIIEYFFEDFNEGMDDFDVHFFSDEEVNFFYDVRDFLKREIKRVSKINNDDCIELVTFIRPSTSSCSIRLEERLHL